DVSAPQLRCQLVMDDVGDLTELLPSFAKLFTGFSGFAKLLLSFPQLVPGFTGTAKLLLGLAKPVADFTGAAKLLLRFTELVPGFTKLLLRDAGSFERLQGSRLGKLEARSRLSTLAL
ncbi:MAG TPA: hypothetical protein VGO82_00415, partial [Enterovirga sp.]|nr:hypothetical protein [Enterovirga sp.]